MKTAARDMRRSDVSTVDNREESTGQNTMRKLEANLNSHRRTRYYARCCLRSSCIRRHMDTIIKPIADFLSSHLTGPLLAWLVN